jgi:hypothetical protein
LSGDWQRHVLASSGYLELGMLDDAALALEEIEPEDKTRNQVLGARVNLSSALARLSVLGHCGHRRTLLPGDPSLLNPSSQLKLGLE